MVTDLANNQNSFEVVSKAFNKGLNIKNIFLDIKEVNLVSKDRTSKIDKTDKKSDRSRFLVRVKFLILTSRTESYH